jgi:hypothetical protein
MNNNLMWVKLNLNLKAAREIERKGKTKIGGSRLIWEFTWIK